MIKLALEVAANKAKKFKPTLFDSGIGARLPKEYRKFYDEWKNTEPEPVHYIPEKGKWKRDEKTGEVKRIENIPLPSFVTKELDKVLTGGEGIVFCFHKKKKYSTRTPYFYVPITQKSVVYSEILDKYLRVIMTTRVIDLIHKHQGFDTYILETRACDLRSLLALQIKRKLLYCLQDKDLPYDETKNKIIYEKYKKYIIPPEELEWYGLDFEEACEKQEKIEKAQKEASIVPLKHVFRKQLLDELKLQKASQ